MAATAFESLLQRIAAVLAGAGTRVVRHHAGDEWPAQQCPLVFVRRGPTSRQNALLHGLSDHELMVFVHCVVAGDDWETTADALHQAVHVALTTDPELAAVGLDVVSTEARGSAGEITVGELVAAYTASAAAAADLTRR